ncbi:winged helix-turn-helix domain-containing protein [Rhodoferax saidenbachensis]|uniref:Winged helix-turn-helix domain-containing protein n=1 Tax=Rhodoferax saidenbachensis TaxID=1484693 RepID=A0A1P8KBD3_9BURK|nr:winged helix-turn-helix domain-containing protein [Rhodoferax saidenbachensis]APW43323.1 winged helix-turn-helix domain-containing protein [Rhodoferax saidenbachensis]
MHPTDDLSRPVRLGALSMAKVMRALMDGPCSIQELKVISGLSINTLHEYMRALRKEGVAHIGAWEKDATGRDSLRVYKLGNDKDAPRSKKSKAEVARDCRKRKQDAQLTQSFAVIHPTPVHHHNKPLRHASAHNQLEPALP